MVLLISVFTSVQEAELVMEHAQHFTVPRCIMGSDGRLKVFAPHRRASRAHLEGNQLIHTWNTGEVRADGADTCARAGGGAYRPPWVAPSGGSREQDRSPRCPATSALVSPWRCTLISTLGPGPGLPEQPPAENNFLRSRRRGRGGAKRGAEQGEEATSLELELAGRPFQRRNLLTISPDVEHFVQATVLHSPVSNQL